MDRSEVKLTIPVQFLYQACYLSRYHSILPDINECLDSPCNNGTCNNTNGSYTCLCEQGWTGQHCDVGKKHFQVTYCKVCPLLKFNASTNGIYPIECKQIIFK